MDQISPILKKGVLEPIVEYLNSKGMMVTVQELSNVLLLPTKQVQPPAIPNFATVAAPPPAAKREKKPVQEIDPTRTCQYRYNRKTKEYEKGELCKNQCVVGHDYCPDCLKKMSKTKDAGTGGAGPSDAEGAAAPTKKEVKKDQQIEVVAIQNQPGFFREVVHNFYLERQTDNTVFVIGVFDDNDDVRPLTDDEKKIAFQKGFKVREEIRTPELPKPTIPSIPSLMKK